MVETRTGHNRSNGISYDEILATDRSGGLPVV